MAVKTIYTPVILVPPALSFLLLKLLLYHVSTLYHFLVLVPVRKSLGAQNYVAHLKHRIDEFKAFLSETEPNNHNTDLQKALIELLPKAIDNIKNAMDSDDDERRFIASLEVLRLLQKY